MLHYRVKTSSAIPEMLAQAEVRVAHHIEETCLNIEAEAKRRSRVDTGYMRGNWTTAEVEPGVMEVFNETEYVLYHEYGTVFMSAQPMLGPAIEMYADDFVRGFHEIYQVTE